jgi:hypothetical protein
MYQRGDRIRMVFMPNDPHPIPAGTEGTIESVSHVNAGWAREQFTQLHVKWDNGRGLSCICPPDIVEVIKPAVAAVNA